MIVSALSAPCDRKRDADAGTDVGVVVTETEWGLDRGDDALRDVRRLMNAVKVFA